MQEIKIGDALKIEYDGLTNHCKYCSEYDHTNKEHIHITGSSRNHSLKMIVIVANIKNVYGKFKISYCFFGKNQQLIRLSNSKFDLDGLPFEKIG